jgi:hypothetical protein
MAVFGFVNAQRVFAGKTRWLLYRFIKYGDSAVDESGVLTAFTTAQVVENPMLSSLALLNTVVLSVPVKDSYMSGVEACAA